MRINRFAAILGMWRKGHVMHHGELLSIAKQNNKEIYTQDRLEQEIKNRLHKGKLNIIEVKPINILQHNLLQKKWK